MVSPIFLNLSWAALDPWSKIYEEVVVWMELLIMRAFLPSHFLCRSRLTIDGHPIVVLVIMEGVHPLHFAPIWEHRTNHGNDGMIMDIGHSIGGVTPSPHNCDLLHALCITGLPPRPRTLVPMPIL